MALPPFFVSVLEQQLIYIIMQDYLYEIALEKLAAAEAPSKATLAKAKERQGHTNASMTDWHSVLRKKKKKYVGGVAGAYGLGGAAIGAIHGKLSGTGVARGAARGAAIGAGAGAGVGAAGLGVGKLSTSIQKRLAPKGYAKSKAAVAAGVAPNSNIASRHARGTKLIYSKKERDAGKKLHGYKK